ncbi:SpoIIE family protein phosphatase [Cellulomonas sp. PhB143]|uniref:ATP-binding SpoIIE family protein phosphatase n=1 Tax=Cellulomonas sp. PhB143 TaxID=2485186 RepID=UPI000F48E262|nr:SpoIIE family protein phosphatase [Cellulomonas sp. PhB143]ROS76502.1 serine phosphatase RsbU (regulator of sigma subunit) [Cellulomonas sp. PhB143]
MSGETQGSADPYATLPEHVAGRVAQHSSVPMFVTGSHADAMPVLFVNDAFARLSGFTTDEIARRGPDALEGLLSDDVDFAPLRDAVRAGVPATHTVKATRSDGRPLWTRVFVDPVPGPRTGADHWVGVVVDESGHYEQHAAQAESLAHERGARTGLDAIAQVSELLADLERPDVLGEISERLSRTVVAWAGFYLNDGGLQFAEGIDVTAPPSGRGRTHRSGTAARHAGRAGADETDALGDPVRPGGVIRPAHLGGETRADPVQRVLDGIARDPVLLELATDEPRGSASRWLADDLERRLPQGLWGRAIEVHPVPGRRNVLGVLVVVPRHQRDAGVIDVRSVLHVTGRRAGLAIDNARLYAREHRLAETLQRAMLPEQAEVDGLDVWTYYAPNSEHAQVGGDWYDVLQVTRDVVGLVIGDVVGHDVEAAAAMGQLRSVVRSYAYERRTPGPVLERVDALVAGMRIPRSASLVYGTLSRGASADGADGEGPGGDGPEARPAAWLLEYSRAGHLPPLLVRNGMVTQLGDAGGPLIGFGARPRATAQASLYPGDTLLLYTDGLIERRDRALRVGLDALVETVALVEATDAAGIGEELLTRLAEAPEDDVAVVVVRVPDPDGDAAARVTSPRTRRWLLPSEVASIARARHAVRRTCLAWGVSDAASAELVVSEIVANGVLHGWGHIALRLFDTGEGLRIEVEDSNPAPPIAGEGHANRAGGFGMQIVERLADWGWRPSPSGKIVWARMRPSSGVPGLSRT